MTEEQGKAGRAPERGPLPIGAELTCVVARRWGTVSGYVGFYVEATAGWYAFAVADRWPTEQRLDCWIESPRFDEMVTALAFLNSFEAWLLEGGELEPPTGPAGGTIHKPGSHPEVETSFVYDMSLEQWTPAVDGPSHHVVVTIGNGVLKVFHDGEKLDGEARLRAGLLDGTWRELLRARVLRERVIAYRDAEARFCETESDEDADALQAAEALLLKSVEGES